MTERFLLISIRRKTSGEEWKQSIKDMCMCILMCYDPATVSQDNSLDENGSPAKIVKAIWQILLSLSLFQ